MEDGSVTFAYDGDDRSKVMTVEAAELVRLFWSISGLRRANRQFDYLAIRHVERSWRSAVDCSASHLER
jgi:hypothetical protein